MLGASVHPHLECLVLEVHLEQRVSHQVSEATAVEVAVWPCVTPVIVDLRELQATKLVEVISMEILVLAEHLLTKSGSTSVSTELLAQRCSESLRRLCWTFASNVHKKRKNSGKSLWGL